MDDIGLQDLHRSLQSAVATGTWKASAFGAAARVRGSGHVVCQ